VEPQVHFVTIATADLDAARLFYRDGLGWEPLLDVPGEIIFFQVGHGLVLGLYDSERFDRDLDGDLNRQSPTTVVPGVTLSHNVNSRGAVDETVNAAISAGAVLLKQPQRADFGGYHGHVRDPNGVVWEIAHNPGWRIDETGRVILG